jgi:Ran GTPase-activating protein (RanGAP) involved in mRNA processing and transport
LESNSQVHALWLKRNPLGVDGAKALAKLLSHNRNLRTLDLVNTLICREGVAVLVDALVAEDYPLERLYLGGNFLDESVADDLGRLLRGNRHLQELYLSVNRLGDGGISCIAGALQNNQRLKVLGLASNGLSEMGAKNLCNALEHHPCLQHLDLGYARSTKILGGSANCIGDQGALHIAQLIRHNSSLIHLDIRRNGIGIHGLRNIAESLTENKHILELIHDKIRVPWLRQEIREKLTRNRAGKTMPEAPADVQAIRSVYR